MADADTQRLLGSQDHDDSTTTMNPSDAPALARWLGALKAGRLPDNAQLYAGIYRIVGLLEGIAASEPYKAHVASASTSGSGSGADGALHDTANVLREAGRWLYGQSVLRNDDDVAGAASHSNGKDLAHAQKDEDGYQPPRGNEAEQIQRLLWHGKRALQRLDVDVKASVGLDLGKTGEQIQEGAEKVKEGVKEAAEAVNEDTKEATSSLKSITEVLLTAFVPEVQAAISETIIAFREYAAGVAGEVGGRADAVEGELHVSSQEKESDSPVKDLAEATKRAGKAAVRTAHPTDGSADEKARTAKEMLHDKVVEKVGNALSAARSDESYQHALRVLVHLTQKYAALAKKASEKVVEAIPESGEEALGMIKNKAAAVGIDPDLEVSHDESADADLYDATMAARGLLEGLAGGQSLRPVLDAAQTIQGDLQGESGLRQWFEHLSAFLNDVANAPLEAAGVKEGGDIAEQKGEVSAAAAAEEKDPSEPIKAELRALLTELQEIFDSNSAVQEHVHSFWERLQDFGDAVRTEPAARRIRSTVQKLVGAVTKELGKGVGFAVKKSGGAIWAFVCAALPSMLSVVKVVPLPRVEFKSDTLEASVDDVVLSTIDLIPDRVRIKSNIDYELTRDAKGSSSNTDSSYSIHVEGLRLALKDISFYVRETATAPSPTRCGGCCGCGASRSCAGGPAEWFSYRENALLDIGFPGSTSGLGIDVDFIDAGQDYTARHDGLGPARDALAHQGALRGVEDPDHLRSTFFAIQKVRVDAGAFDFAIHHGRHWMINAMLRGVARPIVKLVLSRVAAAQIQVGLERADEAAYDVYSRAQYWAREIKGREEAGWWDYLAVLLSKEKGKSPARLRYEFKMKQKEEREKKEKEREEQRIKDQQPGKQAKMEVKKGALIRTDPNGSYELAIGATSPLLPEPWQSGPRSLRTELRRDVAHGDVRRLARRSTAGVRAGLGEAAKADVVGTALGGAKALVGGLRDVREGVSVVEAEEEQGAQSAEDDEKNGWRSEAFDL